MSVGLVLVCMAIGIAAAIGIGVLVLAVVPWRLRSVWGWERSSDSPGTRWSRSQTVWLVICGVVVAGGAELAAASTTSPISRPQALPGTAAVGVQFVSPHDVQGEPLPAVGCTVDVTGKGGVPAQYDLVLGSLIRDGDGLLPLEGDVQWTSATSWHATVYFGNASDAGKTFDIEAVVIPKAWEAYLLGEAHYYGQSGQLWWASGQPPDPAEVVASVAVTRLHVPKGQCA
jgi:hypothetical protein